MAPSPVPPLNTFTFTKTLVPNYVIPPGVTSITVEVWGGGGRGGSRTTGTAGTGGGGGGAYSRRTVAVTPGQIYVVNVGAGSTSNTAAGGDTWVSPSTVGNAFVLAKGGNSAANNVTTGATGGAAGSGIGDVRFSGGNGGNAPSTTSSGGGGSSAGISANGTNASGTTGGVAPLSGGNGANGRTTAGSGTAGSLPGGGGSGAVRGTTGSPAGGSGAHGKVQINLTFDVNAGPDQTQCNNALFQVSTNPPLAGYSFSWSVVSGTGFIYDNWSTNTQITVPAGSSATVRLSVTDGTTTITDDVVLTNTTSCTPSCVNPININGDLEQQGTANAYNLSFQGTPASVIFQNSNPVGWAERYGTTSPNTTSFTGAYYLNKTGVNGDPHSGSKFIYMAGEGICLSNLKTWQNISCGKTYRVSVWVAAYSNSGTQSSSPFAIEFNGGGPNVPSFAIAETLRAPASASWNNLNWQRYSFEFTIPSTGYEWGDFLFTTYDNVNGIVIDDMCVEEVFNGAFANAGPDQFRCDNTFVMAANTPTSGYTGSWSIVSGTASVSNTTSPTSNVTISSGNSARLRWTVSGSGSNTFFAIHPQREGGFESCCSPYDNGWTAVNNGTNNWVVGTGGGSTGGSQAAYISNNGGTSAAYNITTAQTSHLYRDVTIHPGASGINLQFDWQNLGESGFDRLLVYTAPTTLDPAAGTPASSSTTLTGATLVSSLNLHSRQHFTNELISLPASLAGTTFRLIFAWQNNNTGGTNWLPVVIDNVSLSYNLTTCNDFDEVTIVNNTANSGLTVNNANICPGTSATLTATGCNAGNLLWSNGATSNSITVFPTTTSTYTFTCTPVPSANLLTNGNFESATNLQGWTNWDNASITTNPADVYAGSKAVFLNGSVSYAGVAQGFATTPGQRFRVRFYAKTTNSNALPLVRYHVYDDISHTLDDGEGVHITSTNHQLYEFFVTTPPNTTYLTIFAETSDKGGLYVDDFEVVSINGCTSTALSTVTVGETNVVQNPEFNSGTTSWELYAQGGAAATLNHDNTSQLSGVNSARINISTATGTDWHVQFVENGLTLEAGKTYTLSFRARAAAARVINASVDLGQDPWTNYLYQNVNVTTTGQLFTYTFTQPAGTSNGRVVFNLGQSNQTVWIDDVKLFEACSSLCDPNNSNAPPFCAPTPICNTSNTINWSQSINSTNGNPGLVRFVACGGTVTYTLPISLPAEFNGPVSVNITDAVSWDGYSGRNTVSQSNESWRVLFRKNGSTVYASPFTNDVPDNVNQGYWRGSLGSSTFLPNGADQIIIEHWGVSNNNTACNSVIPASVCISYAVCTPPAAPTTTSASRCGPGTVTLTAAGCSGGTLRWYTASSGGSSIGTGASFTTPSISSTTTYFVACESGGCESTTRTAAVATVNNVNAFVSGILNLCPSNNTTTLTGNGGGTYVWSTGATSSSITVSPVSTTTYTLTVTNGGCSTAVTATVNVGLSCCAGHVTSNIIAEYNFSEGTGSVVNDVSGFGTPLNLTIQNPANTTWVTGCGLRINSSTRIASTGNATKIRTALQATNAMTVEAWVQAANTTQNGPARIVSMSTNTSERNFTLGQGTSGGPGTVWAFRTRQSGTNDWNGMPERTTTANSATTNLTHLVFTRDAAGVERFYINGVQNGTWTQTGNFSNWSDYVLNLGNEQTNDRPWLGTLYNVIIYSNALSAAEVTQNFSAGSKGDCSNCPPPDCITQLCAPLSCPSGNCYTNNLIVNPDFETNVNNWIASNGQVSQGGGGRYGNFIQVNVSDLAGTYTAYQDVNFGAGQGYRFEGNVAKHGVNNNVKVYLEFYNGSTYLSKTADFNVTMNFDGWNWENFGFQGITPANTTKIRIVAWCNGNAIKMDKVSLIGCTNITSTANANNVCVGGTINLTSTINLNNVNPVKQLVSNGGFVSGSVTGFSTDVPSGSFGFTTNPQNANGSWVWGTDNTTGTGNLMWFSDDNAASNRRQWFNTYTVVPNTTYTLSFWVRNVWSGGSNPTLFWTVNGTQVGSTITPAFGSNWVQLSTTWNSGSNTSATFAVVLQTNSWNFDFALDDISITGTETTYLWSGPNSYSSSLQNNNLTNAISTMAGTYAVITSAGNGCTASSNVNVVVNSNNTVTTNATRTLCVNTALSPTITHTTTGATGIGTITGLPTGVTAAWASNTITISGTPTASGTFNYTIPLTGGCGAVNATGTITVTANNTVTGIGSATTCINTAITTITHTTTGATGIGTITGLPTGVTAAWAGNTITISGTPTASGTFNYTIPLTGGCGAINATGTITVTSNNTATTNATRTLCINTALSPTITHTTTGATGIGTTTGLPTGVTATWASNTITISGTPTASGTFNYTIPLTGGCGVVNATGTITVTANNTATTNATRTLCVNTALSPTITHTTTGATGIGTITGLPTGVTAAWAGNTITISGTPTASGTFNYTIPLTGGCGAVNATGTITVTANNTVTGIGSATTCINTAITTITHTTTGATGIGTTTGLPTGVTAAWASNTITISGTPTASGTFNYTIPLTGGCGVVNATGTITVTPNNTVTTNATRTLCVNTVLSPTITHTTTGATGIGTATGLPTGVTATWASNTITISGTPTASGTFNYTIPLTGGCGVVNATGTITVTANNTATTNATRTLCVNTSLSPTITHTTTGATGIGTATGLPTGVTATWASNTITISGTPTASGTFNYTIPLTGGCGVVNATGTVTVTANNTVTGIGSATTCINTAITTITHTTTGATGIGTATGLPTGVMAAWASNTITISGTPTASGTFNYTIPLTGGCGAINATGTITVNINPTAPIVGTITQPTCTTPTGSVVLSGLPSTGSWTIIRTPGGTTYNGTGTNFTVTALPVNTTYTFTVTNSNTCSSPASVNVVINAIPSNPTLGGASAVCIGSTANVTPATAGTWTSSNTSIASITNAGLVTGVTAGSVTLTYTRTSDGCSNTRPFTVNSNPTSPVVGTITQPTCTTPAGSVVLNGLPSTGSWTITRTPGGVTYTGTGTSYTVNNLPSDNSYTFTVTNINSCISLSSASVGIDGIPSIPTLGGDDMVCVGGTANVTPSTSGSWLSGNTSVATINNAGLITGIAPGMVILTYTRNSNGCSGTHEFTVYANPTAPVVGAITQPTCSTPTGSVLLSGLPSTGNWTITRTPGGTTYTGTGTNFTVTGLPVNTTYNFTITNQNNCTSLSSADVSINQVPGSPVINGASAVCTGSSANITPASGGTWTSSNTSVATITNAGLVTGLAAGSVTLTYTRTSDGCSNTRPFTVNANPSAPVVGTITQPTCTTPTGTVVLSGLPSSGNWTITRTPGGTTYTGTGTSFTVTGLPVSTTYTFTITNSNICTSPASANVAINTIPGAPVLGGASAVCVGSTANVTPATAGTWASSNNTVATITNAGLVTGVAAGSVTLTYTRTSDGCSNTRPFTVNPLPESAPCLEFPTGGRAPCFGAAEICDGGSIILKGKGYGTPPLTFMWNNGIGAGADHTVTLSSDGLPTKTYTFILTVTDGNGCSDEEYVTVYVHSKPDIDITGSDNICVGNTSSVTPVTGGTWSSSNTTIATVTNAGLVNGIAPGTVNLTYTRTSDGCANSVPFTVNANPTAPIVGTITQPNCAVPTGSVVLNNLPATGNYTINQSPGGISYNATGSSFTINGLSPNTNYTFTVTSAQNCTSPASASVNITGVPSSPSVSIDYNGSVCLEDNKELSAIVTGGIAPFTYLWNGPSGFTASTQTVVISTNGNYYLTVTDANLCKAVTSGFVYERYEPFVVSLQTKVCEGQSVVLDVNSSSAVSYLWGSNAGNNTTKMVTVTPQVPSSTYLVTVTNDLGCTAVPEITIDVDPRPVVSVTGSDIICQEQTTQLSPSTGGVWSSTNPGVATVNNSGLVTGISAGTATFVFTNSTTNCASHPSAPVTVHAKPVVAVTGPNPICIGQTTTLSPSTGGTWTSSNVAVATVNNSGIVTGISTGSVTFTYTNTSTSCVSNASTALIVQNLPSATITGNGSVCESSNIILSASVPGGTWTSSNHAVAVINNSGIVSGISQGTVTITYQYGTGVCSGQVQKNIEVLDKPTISYTGDQTICVGQTTTLSSGQSGIWTSSNPMIATISQSGVVTGVSGGMATFTFENLATGCLSDASEVLTVYEKPTVSLNGPSTICLGSTTQVTPSSGGVWTSSNPLIATITNNGVITSTGIGTTSFTFTDNLTGCSSDGNISVSVGAALSAAMDYHGSICLTDTSKLFVIPSGGTPAFTYQWVGPLGFTGNTQTIDINTNGNYFVTITDALGCKANLSGFVYQRFDPFIVNLSSSVCEGQSVNLSVNAPTAVSYLWSPNASNAVTSSVQVIPVLPSSTYFVTVTNNLGCKAVANASVLVNPKPLVNITGGSTICIGQTTTMTPSSGGSWVALHPSVATISQTGIVTGTGFGNARFLFTNSTTGCTSDTSGIISVNSSTNIAFVGPSSICAGDQTSVSPGSGGSWVSSNTSVATVNNAGLVAALSPGVAQLTYTNNLGCTTNGSLSVTVHDKPAILLDGPSQICIGSTTRFLPSNGGTWTTSHASIASINNSGLVTGISQGTARFVYTNAFTGCKSDSSAMITVLPRPQVQITGNNPICVGSTTTLSPNTGGMWMSSNPSVASVTTAGIVTGLGQGSVTFTFTHNTTGCSSLPTAPLTVNARPVVSVTGPNGICIGGTTTLSPSTGGTWTVVNPTVASVTNAGIVTGLTAGLTGFIFTNSSTGCVSNATNNVTVYGRPTVNINSTSICVGATTTVTPSSGGIWSSSNTAVATVNGSGLVTGLSAGTVTFTFTENSTGCISNPTSTLQVFGKPVVSITGPTNICVGQTTTLQPITGGAWSSLSPSVATVSNSGIVTGIANGSARFIFTTNQGCASDPSGNITINARPVINITGLNPICIGATTQLLPASGGTWVSSHPSVASVNNAGLVTGMAAGGSRFVFTLTSTGCSSDSSSLITVNAPPIINLLGSPSICIGQTSQVSPTAGGTWMSLNPTVATISNSGFITGVSAGQASFTFVQTSTGCQNTLSNALTVKPRPDISLTGPSQICIGATTQFTPNNGGTWTSLMTSVATINQTGLVTGINQGQATFRFTSTATGCTSLASLPVTVLGRPTVLLDGPNSICIGNVTQMLPNSGGSWTSTNPLVATISQTGLVTGTGTGSAQFVFTDENTGCVSNPGTTISVTQGATVILSGPSTICTGYSTIVSASSAGVWYSTNPLIAKVSSNGMVTGIAPGKVSFYFQESATGCLSYLQDDILTVTQCTDADFNVTAVNVSLSGNIHTNDEVPVGTTYNTSPYLIGKPDGSLATLTMLADGKYTFSANTPGEYVYHVPVCIPGMGSSCPVTILEISVVNPFTQRHNIVTNLDITYTIQDQPVIFSAQVNDDCISASGCMVDPQMITVIVPPNHGNASLLTDGSLLYTPASGFIGFDTLTYQVCATNDTGNCSNAVLIVTVMSSDASNSLAAADDFYAIPKGGSIIDANVLLNDVDPEGGNVSITPQGNAQNPVVIGAGSYYINSEGVLHFQASPEFTGPVDIVYTICDSVSFCVNATIHILVVDNMKLRIRAYLEGALMENKDALSSSGRPLMRDDLRNNKFTNSNLIPSIDPYSNPVGFIDIRHHFNHVGPSNNTSLTTIQNPSAVFAVTGENAIVDWVFIELRSKQDYGVVLATRSALIQRDGDVVDLDGISFVEFPGLKVDSCYVVLKHRNHLGVMSLKIATSDLVDFTSPSTPVFDYGTSRNDGYNYTGLAQKADVALGYMSLWAGDFDGSGKIKFVNPDDDQNFLFIEVLFYPTNTDYVANYNFVHGYLQGDYDLNGKSKYDNPDDDKNMLFYQVLFYPLNANYTSNFNFITEQVPPKNIN
ncbi:MAG: Ig-like domain-containing protein [Saprospiraceae bacterium]|nr:Ig-like domain-containing protein [Saprospiraceae bacterium]